MEEKKSDFLEDVKPERNWLKNWKSDFLVWGIACVAVFAGIFHQEKISLQHDVYKTKEECLKDWQEEQYCTQTGSSTGFSSGNYWVWHSPTYESGYRGVYDSNGNAKKIPAKNSSISVVSSKGTASSLSRGGFGGRASSAS